MRKDDPGFDRQSPSPAPAYLSAAGPSPRVPDHVRELHARCGIYTRIETVQWFLDEIGWTVNADLTEARLLEPSCGDGVFLAEAAARLCESFRTQSHRRTFGRLVPRLLGFELHPCEAAKARKQVRTTLVEHGVSTDTAHRLVGEWIRSEDFLLADVPDRSFSHVVGNPPYVRWSKVPIALKRAYENKLPSHAARGDLCLAFLDRALSALGDQGRIGFLCSDRWLYSAYAVEFRKIVLPDYIIERCDAASDEDVFETRVNAYPIKLIARRRKMPHRGNSRWITSTKKTGARTTHKSGRSKYLTLEEAGCRIRVGPALGPERAFVGTLNEIGVEPELLAPYIGPRELGSDSISWKGRYVVCMHDESGALRDLTEFPKLRSRLRKFQKRLQGRAIVKQGAPWHRTIDRVRHVDWTRPKLLVPEMTKEPRVILDFDGYIPSHGIYAIFAPDDDVEALYEKLRDGKLAQALEGIAPKVNGGYVRCYKRFLSMVSIEK